MIIEIPCWADQVCVGGRGHEQPVGPHKSGHDGRSKSLSPRDPDLIAGCFEQSLSPQGADQTKPYSFFSDKFL
jgi:hypothetical protein